MRQKFISMLFAILICFFSGAAAAQQLNFLDETAFGQLNKEDLTLVRETISKAVQGGQKGEPHRWKNPQTGSEGSVTLLDQFTKDSRPCARIALENMAGDRKGSSETTWCKISDGSWKAVP